MIQAGKFDKRINIEQRSTDTDELGQPIETWTLVAAVWAHIRFPSGLSSIKADADVSTVKASIRVRYMVGIDAGMRVVHGSDIYDIKAVLPNQSERFVDLVCEVTR